MDRFTDTMLGKSGLLAMVGKAERGPETVESIAKYHSAYLIAVGGAAFLVSNAIRAAASSPSPNLAWKPCMNSTCAILPVTVGGGAPTVFPCTRPEPKAWAGKFAGIPVAVE